MKKVSRSKVDNAECFAGSAVVYAIDETGNMSASACDYEVTRDQAVNPEQLRHHFISCGRKNVRYNEEMLDTEILVLLGREASPRIVVEALRRIAGRIEKRALLINENDDQIYETIDGAIIVPSST